MMLIYENLHWVDESSLQLLHHLAPSLGRVRRPPLPGFRIGDPRSMKIQEALLQCMAET